MVAHNQSVREVPTTRASMAGEAPAASDELEGEEDAEDVADECVERPRREQGFDVDRGPAPWEAGFAFSAPPGGVAEVLPPPAPPPSEASGRH